MKKILSFLVAFLIMFTSFGSNVYKSFATDKKPDLTAGYAVLMDYETGQILYSKNANSKLYPASTTKAWTAFVVLKHVKDLNQVIEIKDLPVIEGSSMYLKNGEAFTVKELLDALLIHSSNDAAYVLSRYTSGSEAEFVKLMNKEAKAIGAKNTHFNNSHGLPDLNHYTTAYDMALMTRKAMGNEIFKNIVKTKSLKFEPSEAYPYERYFLNTNKFLTSTEKMNYKGKEIDIKYDIVDGIKTGYTDDAGRCLLSSAQKNDMRLISAVFKTNGNDLYVDSRTLLDYGFENFYSTTIVKKEDYIASKKILFSKQGKLLYEPEQSYKLVLPNGTKEGQYKTEVKLDNINLPIKKGDKVGNLEIYNGTKLEHTINLISTNNVNSVFESITKNKNVMYALVIALVFIVILIIIYFRKKSKKSNKNNLKFYSKKRRR